MDISTIEDEVFVFLTGVMLYDFCGYLSHKKSNAIICQMFIFSCFKGCPVLS